MSFHHIYRLPSNDGSKTMNKLGWISKLALARSFLVGVEAYAILPTAWYYIKSLSQTTFFLALVMCAYDVGAMIASPVAGFVTDRLGNPRTIFIFSCILRVVASVVYSVNLSAYFPLLGRLLSGLTGMGTAVLYAQIALQTSKESRGGNFVLVETVYCLGAVFGPVIGSAITFRVNVLGWKIDEGNSPGIVLSIIWLVFLIFSLVIPKDIWVNSGDRYVELNSNSGDDEEEQSLNKRESGHQHKNSRGNGLNTTTVGVFRDSRVVCLLFLIFSSEVFSCTSTFYVPILALDHFHLQLIHTKLLFLNCTIFTILVFVCLYLASQYVDERMLILLSLILQIIAISFLTFLALSWDQMTDIQYYILVLYICFGMPYFLYPFGTFLLSKVTDSRNATFVQGLSYATLHFAILLTRVTISFVFTKISLICYCAGMIILWLGGVIWYGILYDRVASSL